MPRGNKLYAAALGENPRGVFGLICPAVKIVCNGPSVTFFFFFLTKKILYCQKRLEEIVGVGGKTPAKLRRHGENHPKSEYWTY